MSGPQAATLRNIHMLNRGKYEEEQLPSKQVNQCIQDTGVGFINAAKTLKGPERHCIRCILDHTVFRVDIIDAESMARQESTRMVGRKAATPSERMDPLIHKMGSSMALSRQRKLHLPRPPLNGSEVSQNLFSNGWKGR